MQQADKTVPLRDLFHRFHDELVLVAGGVGVGINGSHLVLGGGDLVVLRLGQHAELPQLLVQILHIGGDPRAERAEVMVVQLLPLGGLGAEQRAPAKAQIHALEKQLAIDEEIFLLRADLRRDLLHGFIAEKVQHAHRFAVHGLH